jgi:hypothetical protein
MAATSSIPGVACSALQGASGASSTARRRVASTRARAPICRIPGRRQGAGPRQSVVQRVRDQPRRDCTCLGLAREDKLRQQEGPRSRPRSCGRRRPESRRHRRRVTPLSDHSRHRGSHGSTRRRCSAPHVRCCDSDGANILRSARRPSNRCGWTAPRSSPRHRRWFRAHPGRRLAATEGCSAPCRHRRRDSVRSLKRRVSQSCAVSPKLTSSSLADTLGVKCTRAIPLR